MYIFTFTSKLFTFIYICVAIHCPWFPLTFPISLVVMNNFMFCFSGKVFISPSSLNSSFARHNILIGSFLHLVLQIYHSIPFWCAKFMLRNPLIFLWGAEFPIHDQLLLYYCFQNFLSDFWWFDHNGPWYRIFKSS